jgi:hypothetical protein
MIIQAGTLDDDGNSELGLRDTVETEVPARAEADWAEVIPPGWRGGLGELSGEALTTCWAEAIGYARWEIGRYGRWRGLDEPVLADGYDAEGVVQSAFERLLCRERKAGAVPILYSAEDIRRELQVLIKRRVRWLHERSETRLLVGEWDVLPPRENGDLVSIFEYLPGALPSADQELMRKEKEQLLREFKSGFEGTLDGKKELREVFGRVWDGQKRREVAQEMGTDTERVKALQAQLRRRLVKFCAEAQGGVAEMLDELRTPNSKVQSPKVQSLPNKSNVEQVARIWAPKSGFGNSFSLYKLLRGKGQG